MTQAAQRLVPDGDPWMFDLLLAAMDGEPDECTELVLAATGGDARKLAQLIGLLLGIAVGFAEKLAGDREQLRTGLRNAAVLHQLDGLTG